MAINYTNNVCQKCVQSQPLMYFVLLVCRKKHALPITNQTMHHHF